GTAAIVGSGPAWARHEGDPILRSPAIEDLETNRPERLSDLGFAVTEDARGNEPALRRDLGRELRGEPDEQRRDEVRQHDLEDRLARRETAEPGLDPPAETVPLGVGTGRLNGDRVGVHAEDTRGAEPGRGDREDPGATADVEDAG